MDRSTKRDLDGYAYFPCCFEEPSCGYGYVCKMPECNFLRKVCDRIAAYEDTGLEPNEVEAVKNAMMGKAIADIMEFDGIPVDRLKELAQAEKDGRLVVLPCAVGERWSEKTSGMIIEVDGFRYDFFSGLVISYHYSGWEICTCNPAYFKSRFTKMEGLAPLKGDADNA